MINDMDYIDRLNTLQKNLTESIKVNSYDSESEKQSQTLAHTLTDVQESCNAISNELIPKLLNKACSGELVDDVLLEIGDEFRHIEYHMKDAKYFDYLFPKK